MTAPLYLDFLFSFLPNLTLDGEVELQFVSSTCNQAWRELVSTSSLPAGIVRRRWFASQPTRQPGHAVAMHWKLTSTKVVGGMEINQTGDYDICFGESGRKSTMREGVGRSSGKLEWQRAEWNRRPEYLLSQHCPTPTNSIALLNLKQMWKAALPTARIGVVA